MVEKVKQHREQAKGLVLAEGNFEEHPYFRVGDRNASTGVLTYESELRTKDGHILRQSWTVRAAHGRGLPGRFDQDVYVALLQMIDDKGLPEDGWLSFSLYELVELMGRKHSGRDYKQVRDSLRKLAITSIESDNAFYHRGWKEYISDTFSLLSEVKLSEHEDPKSERTDRNRVLLSQYFVDSYKAHYLKNIDVEFYWSLASPIAKRLYRLIDKKRNGRTLWEVELFSLKSRIPLSNYKYASKIKEKLAPAHAELIEKGFLKEITYRKSGNSEFASYEISESFHARKSAADASERLSGEELFCGQRLKAEGMEARVAEELVATYGVARVMRLVEALPYQKNLRNPAGWLRKAIENNYELDMPPVSTPHNRSPARSKVDAYPYQPPIGASKQSMKDYAWFLGEADESQDDQISREEQQERHRSEIPQGSNQEQPTKEPILDPQAIEAWQRLLDNLVAVHGRESLPPWFGELEGGQLEGATLTILVPNSTAANYLNQHFGEELVGMWRERAGGDGKLEVAVDLNSEQRAELTG